MSARSPRSAALVRVSVLLALAIVMLVGCDGGEEVPWDWSDVRVVGGDTSGGGTDGRGDGGGRDAGGRDDGGDGGDGGGGDADARDGGGRDIDSGERVLFRATVKDFQTRIAHADAPCWLLFNAYPEDYARWSADPSQRFRRVPQDVMDELTGGGYPNPLTSGDGGTLELMLPAGTRWGWECDEGEGNTYRKTYQFNVRSDSPTYEGEELWIIPNGLYNLAPALANVDLDSSLGVVIGRLVWDNPASGEEEYVGCATVAPDPATADLRYFGGNDLPLPTAEEGGRDTSHPVNGLFMGFNLSLGPATLTVRVGDTVIGREAIISEGEAVVVSDVHAGAGRPGDTDIEPATANPTPGTCE